MILLYACLVNLILLISITDDTDAFSVPLQSNLVSMKRDTDSGNEEKRSQSRHTSNKKIGSHGTYYQEQREILRSKLKRYMASLDEKKMNNETLTQSNLDYALALSIAADDETIIEKVDRELKAASLLMQPSTYRTILKECSIAGNGIAANKIIQDMRNKHIRIEASDVEMGVAAICKNNRVDHGLWKYGLELTRKYADDAQGLGQRLKVETYNAILSCAGNDGSWSDIKTILDMMEKPSHPQPNLSTYHTVLESLFHSVQGPQLVFQLLTSMKSIGISPSLYTFDLALSILLKRENNNWKLAVDMIEFMHQNLYTPSLVMYNRVISSCAHSHQLGHAASLLIKMKNRSVKPDIVTYNSIISACASLGRWRDALRYLQETIDDSSIDPDIITYTSAIRACTKGRKSEKALELFQDVKRRGIPLDTYIYASAIDACAKGNLWRKSLELLDEMRLSGMQPNVFTYSAAIAACGNSGEWGTAMSLLDQMRQEGMNPNLIAYNAAINALSKASRVNMQKATKFHHMSSGANTIAFGTDEQQLWKRALSLFEQMKNEGISHDSFTYSGVISTLGSCGKLQEALNLIEEMRLAGKANKVSYTAAIDACRGQWESAERLFNQLQEDDIEYDIVTVNSLLSAYMAGDKPDLALKVWNNLSDTMKQKHSKVQLDIISLTIVLTSLERCKNKDCKCDIDNVFTDAVKHQIVFPKDSFDTMWEIDLSGMSFPVARAACRYILNSIRVQVKQGQTCADLVFITGVGKKHMVSNEQSDSEKMIEKKTAPWIPTRDNGSSLREYIRQVLRDDFKPSIYSIVPTRAEGMVQVSSDVLRAWISSD